MEEKKKKKKTKNLTTMNKNNKNHVDDLEESVIAPEPPPDDDDDDHCRISWCAAAAIFCATTVSVLALVVLILALTVFKPYDPTITLASVDVESYTPSITFPPGGEARINITLNLDLLLYNPNRAEFQHEPGTTRVRYRGIVVGDAQVAAGRIPTRGSAHVKCNVTVVGAGLAGKLEQLLEDVKGGAVRFDASSRIVGKIVLLGFITQRSVAASECHVDVAVRLPRFRVVRHQCKR